MNTIHRSSLALALLAGAAGAQRAEVPLRVERHAVSSGFHAGSGTADRLAFEHTVTVDDAAWLRVRFEDFDLGEDSYLTVHSLRGELWQTFDHEALKTWNAATGLFAGNSVTLQLWVAPDDVHVFVDLKDVVVGEWSGGGTWETLCGGDSRVASNDNRMCRVAAVGCTAWRITNGAFLTAGHCVDFDPDCTPTGNGPLVPDGVLDLTGVVEFNVPASNANGTTIPSAPQDQYPILLGTVVWEYGGCGLPLGDDWAVFGVGANATTGLLPHQAYGFPTRVSRETPGIGATMRITGFGLDNTPPGTTGGRNAQSQTNQTSTGDFRGENVATATRATHEYGVDTTGGNSGSAILWNTQNVAIGVHTNGGCSGTSGSSQGNFGTSFEADDLAAAVQQFPWAGTVRYVDAFHPRPNGFEDGTIFRPFDKVLDAVNSAITNQFVSIAPGSYTAAAGNVFTTSTPMFLDAPTGLVTIGN